MNIHNKGTLIGYGSKHPDCKNTLEKWYHDVLRKDWKKPTDVIKDYNKARTIKMTEQYLKLMVMITG